MNRPAGHACVCLGMLLLVSGCATPTPDARDRPARIVHHRLPDLPGGHGLAGMFAGISHGVLIAAGGTNFPDAPFWEGGQKRWHDRVYTLDLRGLTPGDKHPGLAWRRSQARLPEPVGNGVSVTWRDRVIAIGGSNKQRCHDRAMAMRWTADGVTLRELPSLPVPLVNAAGVVVGDALYIAGGATEPDATRATRHFYSLDLTPLLSDRSAAGLRWRTLPAWPGAERILAVAGGRAEHVYLFSGMRLKQHAKGHPWPVAPYLDDAYRYTPATGRWSRLANLPRPVAAACSPALVTAGGVMAVFGGLNGDNLGHDPATYPAFFPGHWRYDPDANHWSRGADLPQGVARVVAPAVPWAKGVILVGGEISPGRRTSRVDYLQSVEAPPGRSGG